MRLFALCAAFVILLVAAKPIKKLRDSTYIGKESEFGPFVALFVSEICERCPKLVTRLEKLTDELADLNLDFYTFDLRWSAESAQRLDAEGAPTLLFVRSPEHTHEYGGNLAAEDLRAWLSKRTGASLKQIPKGETIESLLNKHETIVTVASLNDTGVKTFENTAEYLRDIPEYFHIKDGEPGEVSIYKSGLPKVSQLFNFADTNITSDLHRFIAANQIPLFSQINLSNLGAFLYDMRPFVWFIGSRKEYDTIRTVVKDLLKPGTFKRPLHWVWIDPSDQPHNKDFVSESLQPATVPGIVITDLDGAGRFVFKKEPKAANEIKKWIDDVLDDKEHRILHSEPPPSKKLTLDGFEVLVADTLPNRLLRKDTKLAETELGLLMTWPQCGETCRSIRQGISSIKEWMDGLDDENKDCLRFATIDIHANELNPKLSISKMASPLMLFTKYNTTVDDIESLEKIAYSGSGHEVELWEFLKKHSKCNLNALGRPPMKHEEL